MIDRFKALLQKLAALDLANIFLPLALAGGLVMLLLSAPFQAPDEYVHFYRAYSLSEGTLASDAVQIPQSVVDFAAAVNQDLPGNDQNKQSKQALVNEFTRPFRAEPRVEVGIITTLIYTPVPYLPQTLGTLVGRLVGLPPLFIFYLARAANLLAWALLTWTALRLIPIQKRTLFLLALMPMTLFQAASVSADAVTNGLAFLFVALALRLALDDTRRLTWADWAWLLLAGLLLAMCKTIYVLLVGLALLIPLRRLLCRQPGWGLELARAVGALAVAALAGVGWLQIANLLVPLPADQTLMPNSGAVSYMIANPGTTAAVFWRSLVEHSVTQYQMFIGVLGWADTPLAGWLYPLYGFGLLLTALFDSHPTRTLRLPERLLILAMAAAAVLALMTAFFYPSISVGNGKIGLIQGRYFIPFAPLFLLPLANRRLTALLCRLRADSPLWSLVLALVAVAWLAAVRALLWRYFAI